MKFELRAMQPEQWDDVAKLICDGTNYWYESHGMNPIFTGGHQPVKLFCEVYESLDPGCCVLAISESGDIAGSCFYHPRPSHVSLGIMNVQRDHFGLGIARKLLGFVIDLAQRQGKPLRLVSSALNLDSFSLYTRAGMVPHVAYQDMTLTVPEEGLQLTESMESAGEVRPAVLSDVPAMVELENRISGISRGKDFEYFINNESGYWRTLVLEQAGELVGFLTSIEHAASNMLGPGVMNTDQQATRLILAHLDLQRGNSPVFLIPVNRSMLVQNMYNAGARNCEIHFAQALGDFQMPNGVSMPTFMPETG